MIDKLVSVKEFKDIIISSTTPALFKFRYLINYIELLEQPLELGMFVPCLDGKPLEKPIDDPYDQGTVAEYDAFMKHKNKYQQAESKVLFKGFYYDDEYLMFDKSFIPFRTLYDIKGLQEEFKGRIELTENFKKLITK